MPGESADGGAFAGAALEAGAWGVGRDARARRARSPPRRRGGLGADAPRTRSRSLQRLARALAPRARLPRRRDHRLDRQDLGQGHHPGAAAAAGARQPRELQHRDRPAAGDPRRAARDRGAGAGDGDARDGPDRRAVRDRRARRRRDHERRPRAPGAAGDAGGDRRGEGRDPRRARGQGTAVVPADAEALEPHLQGRVDAHHLRSRRRRLRARVDGRGGPDGGRDRDPRRRGPASTSRSPRPTTCSTRCARSRSASRSTPRSRRWRVGPRG